MGLWGSDNSEGLGVYLFVSHLVLEAPRGEKPEALSWRSPSSPAAPLVRRGLTNRRDDETAGGTQK